MWPKAQSASEIHAEYLRLCPVLTALYSRLDWTQSVGGISSLECQEWQSRLREARDGVA